VTTNNEFYEAVIEQVHSPTGMFYTLNPISEVAHIQHILRQVLTARAKKEVPRLWQEIIDASDNPQLMRQYLLQGDAKRIVARSLEALELTYVDPLPAGSSLERDNAALRRTATTNLEQSIKHLEETISDNHTCLTPAALAQERRELRDSVRELDARVVAFAEVVGDALKEQIRSDITERLQLDRPLDNIEDYAAVLALDCAEDHTAMALAHLYDTVDSDDSVQGCKNDDITERVVSDDGTHTPVDDAISNPAPNDDPTNAPGPNATTNTELDDGGPTSPSNRTRPTLTMRQRLDIIQVIQQTGSDFDGALLQAFENALLPQELLQQLMHLIERTNRIADALITAFDTAGAEPSKTTP
jgi:hypothetical protein